MKPPVWKRAEIDSPCVDICVIHPQEKICIGCFRTSEEIAQWSAYSDAERKRLMQELPSRAPRLKKRRGGRAARTKPPTP